MQTDDAAADGKGLGNRPTVVALGTSAGGLAACTAFLAHLPADTGSAFVIVQHLDPHHSSALVELLGKTTPMPVVQITDGMALMPDRVHVIPPDAALTIADGVLRLLPRGAARPPMPIDAFLRALAKDRGAGAIAVILSGTGSDGSLGVQDVHDHGGITMAQSPEDAVFEGMPASAIATGRVDIVLPASRLGAEIARIARSPAALGQTTQLDPVVAGDALQRILASLTAATGVDFTEYRQTTVGRRIRRRLALSGLAAVGDYADHLLVSPGEVQELARDILIAVTRFFRDPLAFSVLQKAAFPDLIRRSAADGVIRIWAPGCATGEEAYSLAIAFLETARRMHSPLLCQVFATDINETLLDKARRATYPDSIAADVAPERLQRFFTRTGNGYRVSREVRDLCVFSRHNLLSDPPLARMDLVSCRNLLIYLEAAQSHILGRLHFALEPRAYLLLGRSENAASSSDLFEVVDVEARLFRAREAVSGRTLPWRPGARDARRRPLSPAPDPAAADASLHEELIAANEELQSLNEELESSKEEIEAVNEELLTVNQELRSRNAALHVAREFADLTLDTVRSALIVIDRQQVVQNANRSFYRMFHLSPADVEQRHLAEIAPDYFDHPDIQRLLVQPPPGNSGEEGIEVSFDQMGRAHRVLLVNARRLSPGDLFLLSVDDVTQVRQLEADRSRSQKMEAIGHLAAGVAHDFNNLLTVILAGSQMAAKGLPPGSPAAPLLRDVGEAAQRAAALTRQLLAFAGKARVFLERVALSDIVVQTANLLHSSTPDHIELRLDLDRDMPRLLADPSQMHQVVDNLVKNAIEAIGDQPGQVLVRTGRQTIARNEIEGPDPGTRLPPGEYVFLEVQDTGAGLTSEHQRQMFDPFFTTKFTGRGLGLAAVQGIVRQHHGKITVTSQLGRGTAVRVLLATVPALASGPETDPQPAPRRGTETILVVDDDPMVLATTSAVLRELGYGVITAADGPQALELLRATPAVALVILDATMPVMSGGDTLVGLRALRGDLPVLVCSGRGDAATEQAFAQHAVTAFLHKPYSMAALGAQLNACLGPAR